MYLRIRSHISVGASARLLCSQRNFTSTSKNMAGLRRAQIELLRGYSACDVSDALLKLEKPRPGVALKGGYLADIVPFAPASPFSGSLTSQPKVIAEASTLKFVDKTDDTQPLAAEDVTAIPKGSHWADLAEEGTILVIEQPSHQTCAAVGGIMASRMKLRGLEGCVVGGRVRDLAELAKSGLPIWASGRSTVGSGAEAKAYARNLPITVRDVSISPGDIVFCDPLEGIVVIPQHLIDQVLELMPSLVGADDKVKADVENGITVQEAFKKHRS